jgi:hypothetical protein
VIAIGSGQFKAVKIGVFQGAGFVLIASVPDGADGMDHRFGREIAC